MLHMQLLQVLRPMKQHLPRMSPLRPLSRLTPLFGGPGVRQLLCWRPMESGA